VTKVLMGSFGALARAGFDDFFSGQDVEILSTQDDDLLAELHADLPDVVVIDLERSGAIELAERIAARHPSLKIVAWSSVHPTMRVFPRFRGGESYVSELRPELFTDIMLT
jgi:DNA-binding NarL/FixJ family response regulator